MGRDVSDPHGQQRVLQRGAALSSAAAAVILAHGRGASAEDILDLGEALDCPGATYFAPQAADNTWYPYSFLSPIQQNQPWLDSALRLLERIVTGIEAASLSRQQIVFVGFSQGACLASEFVARQGAPFGGLVALTGGLIGPPGTRFSYSGSLEGMPCFFGAGDPDLHVPWARVEESASVFSAMGASVTLRRYGGLPHAVNNDELQHAHTLLSRVVRASP
jgi:phospholipase/carboxylesterase